MRRTVLALAALILISGCQQPAGSPEGEPAAADAPAPVMPADAPPQEEIVPAVEPAAAPVGDAAACRDAIGDAPSTRLVQRCLAVSPATRPPCNALNPCALIEAEIERACEMFTAGEKPAECAG